MISQASADWPALKAWLENEIETLRVRLEDPGCDPREADQLRGEIAGFRKLIRAVMPSPLISTVVPAPKGSPY